MPRRALRGAAHPADAAHPAGAFEFALQTPCMFRNMAHS